MLLLQQEHGLLLLFILFLKGGLRVMLLRFRTTVTRLIRLSSYFCLLFTRILSIWWMLAVSAILSALLSGCCGGGRSIFIMMKGGLRVIP
jgi:hypothetical protein